MTTATRPSTRTSGLTRARIAELRVRCQTQPDAADVQRETVGEFLAAGLYREAIPVMRRLVALCPDDVDAAEQLADLLAHEGDDAGALEHYRRVAEHRPDSIEAWHNLGVAACRSGATSVAREAFERKLALCDNDHETLNDLGLLYAMEGRSRDAADAFERCLTINPRYAKGRDNALQFYWDTNQHQMGIASARRLIDAVGHDDALSRWLERFERSGDGGNGNGGLHETPSVNVADRPRVTNRKIAFVASSDTFLKPIIAHFAPHNQIRAGAPHSSSELADMMRWADLTWFEWCDAFMVEGSRLPKRGKVVCRLHSYEAFTDLPNKVNWVNVDRLILVSETVGEILDQSCRPPVRRAVIHNGIGPEQFPFVPPSKRSGSGRNVASVGYINYKKNPSLLLQMIKSLHDWDKRIELHIAGEHQDPRIKVYIDHLLPRLGIPVTLHGWIGDMPSFYARMDYVISTSLFESFHYAIAEGMLSGCLPLIHAWPGAERLYPPECLFATPSEAIEIVRRYDDSDRDALAAGYRRWIIDRYNWRDRLNEIDALLADVLDEETGPAQAIPLPDISIERVPISR